MPPNGGTRTSLSFTGSGQMTGYASATFGPGTPLIPSTQEPIRFVDYPVGVNTTTRPRAYAPIGFAELRAFANVELVRMAIETRKDQLERLEWQITPTDAKAAKGKGSVEAAIAKVTKFWRKPDGSTPFATWQRLLIEDLLVLDAPTVARLRTRGGGFLGLEVIPGDTIHPLVDETGRRPRGPGDVAYQQVIKGVVWNNLTNDEIIYAPRNPRPNHLYGLSPVEQIIVTINTVIRRQAAQLAWFTAGNQPAGLLNAPATWNPDQIKDMQSWIDSKISGNQAEQGKLLVVPEMKYQAFKDAPLKDDFDEWLARVVAYAFSLPPTPFIKQMNRSTGQTDADRSMEEGLEPLKLWFKRFADLVIQDDLGEPGLEWAWLNTPEIDPKAQAEIDNVNLRNGTACIDEVRDARGLDPLPDGQGAKAMIYTSTGAVTLEQVLTAAEEALQPPEPEQPQAVEPEPGGDQNQPPGKTPEQKPTPKAEPAQKLAKAAATLSMGRPKARRILAAAKRATAKALVTAGDDIAAQVATALKSLGKAAPPADDTSGEFTGQPMAADAIIQGLDFSGLSVVADALQSELEAMAKDSGAVVLAQIGVADEADLVNQIDARAVAYAKTRGAQLVSLQGDRNIVDATRQDIRDVIAAGLDENLSADDIAERVQESTAFSSTRAELIAKTEIADANSQASLDGARSAAETGLTVTKTWELGEDPCDECQENADAGAIGLEDDFPSGDDAPTAHPNCQCCLAFDAGDSAE